MKTKCRLYIGCCVQDAPPAVELDMGKAYFAVLDSKRSKRSSKPSAKGGQKAPPKKKVKKPVRHHAATDLSFKDEIDDWDESQGLQTNAKVSAAKAIDHPPRRRHRSTAPMAGRSLIESFPDKMDTNELLEDDKFLAAAIKSGDISAVCGDCMCMLPLPIAHYAVCRGRNPKKSF